MLKAAEEEGVLILPVIIGQCQQRFHRTPALKQFQAVNDPSEPLSKISGDRRDYFWDKLAARIEDYLSSSG